MPFGRINGRLPICKRPRTAEQKTVFHTVKGRIPQRKEPPENAQKACKRRNILASTDLRLHTEISVFCVRRHVISTTPAITAHERNQKESQSQRLTTLWQNPKKVTINTIF